MRGHTCSAAIAALCLLALMFIHQVFCGPVGTPDDQSSSLQNAAPQRRAVRMTPLWRVMGSKPHGAYCQDHYECSTRICRDGHCAYSQIFHSRK